MLGVSTYGALDKAPVPMGQKESAKIQGSDYFRPELNGHEILEITDDDVTPQMSSQQCLEACVARVSRLRFEHLEEVSLPTTVLRTLPP